MKCVYCSKENAMHHVVSHTGLLICGTCANHHSKTLKLNRLVEEEEKEKEEFTREKVIFT